MGGRLKRTKPKIVEDVRKFVCPNCHERTTSDGEHYNYWSYTYRYSCGDQWFGNDI